MPLGLVAILLAVDSTRGPILAFRHPAPPSSSASASSSTVSFSSTSNSAGSQGLQSATANTASQGATPTSSFSSPSSSVKSPPTTVHPNGNATAPSSTLPSPISSRPSGERKDRELEGTRDHRTAFSRPGLNIYDLSPDDLASLLTPKPALYDARFQLDVDDLTFLGLPFPWRPNPPPSASSSRPSSSASVSSTASSTASSAASTSLASFSSPSSPSTTTTSSKQQIRRSRRRSSLDDMGRCVSPTAEVFVHGFLSPPTPGKEDVETTPPSRAPRARSGGPPSRSGHVRAASAADLDSLRDTGRARRATESGGTGGRGYKMNLGTGQARGLRRGGPSPAPGTNLPDILPTNAATPSHTAAVESSGFQPTMFHVVFVLRCAEYARQASLDTAFSLAVRKISVALRSEQMQSGYVQREVETMLGAIESAHQAGANPQEVHQRLLATSGLARELALVYETLESGGVARFPTEGPTSYALQLTSPYPTGPIAAPSLPLELRRDRANLVPILTTPTQAYVLRPYQTLLLSSDPESVLRELPEDTAQDVESFLLELTPMHSFGDLALVLGRTLEEVYGQARVLLEWRWARGP
ncbi:nitrogen permease regulator of amino acid transport activity 3-domain-containing protein [Piptocephalis cylindrospora]|uniref:Nitrogen permease regulator 3 n=1 Tax=Piptocephalis cylindrospora TaxID=1907219 RepID=A0A4P9Y0G3_9FUNG|nr:nitrogen permease regulator of amino acid transport activity 3-domain-containing protein [Piptocephalis cylindrospora]|eukprot:RKP12218.1 nitrogen permease regulator of amino acid transport activity 3-domain-containing protein [Piptocephalis cylindrospora]